MMRKDQIMTARTLISLIVMAAALPLGGCLSFGEKPPETLMTLTAEQALAVGTGQSVSAGQAVTVLPPSVPQALATSRVAVQAGPTSIAYLKDAQWVEEPNRLFRNLLSETIAARTGRPVLDLRQYALAPGVRLAGRLERFGLDAPSRQVVVTYDATLARGEGAAVMTRRFEARVPVAAETPAAVAPSLNRAANQVAAEVADWIGR